MYWYAAIIDIIEPLLGMRNIAQRSEPGMVKWSYLGIKTDKI